MKIKTIPTCHRFQPALLLVAVLIALGGGCASAPDAPPADDGPPPIPPFTAEQIRDANPPGTRLVFRVLQDQGVPAIRTFKFLDGDAQRAVMETSMNTAQGLSLGPSERASETWNELRDHAAFPPEETAVSRATCTIPAGQFDCWLYVMDEVDEEGAEFTNRYYFDPQRPGPPVLFETERDGVLVFRMELIKDSRR